jgi:UPF0755 protein
VNPRKVRDQRKLKIIFVAATVGLLVVFLTIFSFFHYLNSPAGKDKSQVSFTIKQGESVREIAQNLEEEKLIKNDFLLLVYLKISRASKSIMAGDYLISPSNTPLEIADILTKGKVASKKITIPEGWNINQIGEYLEKQGVCKKQDFLTATKKKYDYDFLKEVPQGASLEGFLFPDTYQISLKATADDVVKVMLSNFDKKLTKEMRDRIVASKYNTYQTVTLASVVEREVPKPVDRQLVAGIFLKRLDEGMPLQSDVTVLFALNSTKKSITIEDTQVDSPYNTYKVTGLPYGPIDNPGVEAINAVLSPQGSDYLYFLAGNDGVTHYAKTLEEHEVNKQKYLN